MNTTCPSCGAELEAHGAAKVIVCRYCSAASLVYQGELSLLGKVAALKDAQALMEIGQTGRLDDRPFTVLGRVRYDYDDGLWDEWSLFFEDGSLGWLQDDEGELSFFDRFDRLTEPPSPSLEEIGVGQSLTLNDQQLFVTELGEASLIGGSGQISSALSIGQRFNYVDGPIVGSQTLGIVMQTGSLTLFFQGRPFERSGLQLDT